VLDTLAENLIAEEERLFPWCVVAFGAGIVCYFGLLSEPSEVFAGALAVIGAALAFAARKSAGAGMRYLCAVLAAAGIGFASAKLRTESLSAPAIVRDIGPVEVAGRIDSVDISAPNKARIVLEPIRVGNTGAEPPSRLRLTLTGAKAVAAAAPGAWISARAELRPPPEPAMPHGYDFARWAYFRGIGGVGFTYGAPKPIDAPRDATLIEGIGVAIEGWRMAMTERIKKAIPGPDGSIAAALITGERGAIAEEDASAYRDSGLAHVLSISGLHLALAGLGIFWVVRALLALSPLLALTQPIKKWAAVAAFASASFYLLISGGGAPALRSYLMLSAMLLGVIADRPALSMRGVAMAAIVILAFQPENIVDPGFQMSFAAVVGLIALAEWAASRPKTESGSGAPIFGVPRRIRRYVLGILAASFVATLATTPFAIYHFDRAASYSLLANLLAEPVVAFVIMPAAAIAVILMPFGLDGGPLQIMGWGVHQMTAIAHYVADLPGSTTLVRAWPDAALLIIVFGGLWLALWRRRWRWLGLAPIAAGFAIVLISAPPDILVARDGNAAAIRQKDGTLAILGQHPDEYTAAQWLLRDGDKRSVEAARAGARCDEEGCVAMAREGRTVALALRPGALIEDCTRANVILSAVPVRRHCDGPELVIDRFAVLKSGAMSVTFTARGAEVETVAQERGKRPWSTPRQGNQ
jgi:competence protein ComEC